MRRLACALAVVASIGCSTTAVTPETDGGPPAAPRVELGTGEVSFVPIAESDATLELVHGPQGGYHVLVAVRVWDLELEELSLVYEVIGATRSLARVPLVLSPARFAVEGDHALRTGDLAILDVPGPADVVGQEVEVRVTATATDGATATDARTVTIVDVSE